MAEKIILIAEDEASVRKLIRNELAKQPIRIEEAENGQEAIEKAEQLHPHVVLLDFLMPKMHGLEVIQKLRSESWGKKIGIIVLTNLPDEPRLVELQKKGECKILSKAEASLEDIVASVQTYL